MKINKRVQSLRYIKVTPIYKINETNKRDHSCQWDLQKYNGPPHKFSELSNIYLNKKLALLILWMNCRDKIDEVNWRKAQQIVKQDNYVHDVDDFRDTNAANAGIGRHED